MTSKRICVYCASSDRADDKYFQAGRDLGRGLAKLNFTVVYGGARNGVMGALADGALTSGGKVIGWIPTFMKNEVQHAGLTEIHEVETMHIRKHGMMMNSEGIIALPGGTGTVEELMEAITWKRLNLIQSPIFIVNLDGFYDPLINLFENMFREKFLPENLRADWIVVRTIDEVLDQLKNLP